MSEDEALIRSCLVASGMWPEGHEVYAALSRPAAAGAPSEPRPPIYPAEWADESAD